MTDKEIDKIWQRVKIVMEEYDMDYGAAATIGSAFGELVDELKKLQQAKSCNND